MGACAHCMLLAKPIILWPENMMGFAICALERANRSTHPTKPTLQTGRRTTFISESGRATLRPYEPNQSARVLAVFGRKLMKVFGLGDRRGAVRNCVVLCAAALLAGSIVDQARITCVPDGPVRAWATPYPFEIVDGPTGNMTILHELNHQNRVVRMGKPLPKYEEIVAHPSYNGHSVGRLEGDTLVIETIGCNEKLFLDA